MYKKVFCTCKVTFFANQTSCCFFNVLRRCLRRLALLKVPYITKLRVQFACVQTGFIFGKIVNYIRFLQFKDNFKKIFGEFGKIHIVGAVHRCLPVCAATLLQSILLWNPPLFTIILEQPMSVLFNQSSNTFLSTSFSEFHRKPREIKASKQNKMTANLPGKYRANQAKIVLFFKTFMIN